jgi:hypothetical protein
MHAVDPRSGPSEVSEVVMTGSFRLGTAGWPMVRWQALVRDMFNIPFKVLDRDVDIVI